MVLVNLVPRAMCLVSEGKAGVSRVQTHLINNNNRKSNPITAINLKIVEPSEKILVIQFEDKTSMRLDYN